MSITFSGWPMANAAVFPTCPVSVPAVAYPSRSAYAIGEYGIVPAHAPLPTAWNLPFHCVGSQTSILMSESADGRSVAETRQNSGNTAYNGFVAGPAGGLNVPGGTTTTAVIVVAGSVTFASSAQVAASTARGARRKAMTDARTNARYFITSPVRAWD